MENTEKSNPLSNLTCGFQKAVVHVGVVFSLGSSKIERPPLRLLFASVWLLAPGRPAPSRPKKPYCLRLDNKCGIAIDRIVMNAEEAIKWYSSESDDLRTPTPLHDFQKGSDDEPLSVGRLNYFPSWPVLGLPMGSEDITQKSEDSPLPFGNIGIARYSRRISDGQEWPDFLDPNGKNKHCQKVFDFLEQHMYIDFKKYPEYMGGMTLAVPDCDVHSVRQFVEPTERGSELLYFHLKAHPGRKLRDLSLTWMESQAEMLTAFETVPVPEDGLVTIERPSSIHGSGLVLTHKVRGVLMQIPVRQFMRQMNMRIELAERRVKISAPETDKKTSKLNNYVVEKKTLASSRKFGDAPNKTDAFQRLLNAKNERLLNRGAKLYDQTWFAKGQRNAALEHIREKIKQARSTIFIADPYFCANQIAQYLFAIERDEVAIEILTSSSAFKKISGAEAGTEAEIGEIPSDTHQKLVNYLNYFQDKHENSIEIKVANTENSLFHDRFLAVDGRVWMLGSSLNSIGIRPTLIMRIPHGEKIISHLAELYNNAIPLSDFKVPPEAPKKPCINCGRGVMDARRESTTQEVEDGIEAQDAQDVNNG